MSVIVLTICITGVTHPLFSIVSCITPMSLIGLMYQVGPLGLVKKCVNIPILNSQQNSEISYLRLQKKLPHAFCVRLRVLVPSVSIALAKTVLFVGCAFAEHKRHEVTFLTGLNLKKSLYFVANLKLEYLCIFCANFRTDILLEKGYFFLLTTLPRHGRNIVRLKKWMFFWPKNIDFDPKRKSSRERQRSKEVETQGVCNICAAQDLVPL